MSRLPNVLTLAIMILGYIQLIAQPCRVSSNINPITNTDSWMTRTELNVDYFTDEVQFFTDKQFPKTTYIKFDIMTPIPLSSSIGDSAWVILDNGYTIQLINEKNYIPKRAEMKAVLFRIEYFHVGFVSKITEKDVSHMAAFNIKEYAFDLHPRFVNPYVEINFPKDHPAFSKRTTFTKIDDRIEIRTKKLYKSHQKDIRRTAACAKSYF